MGDIVSRPDSGLFLIKIIIIILYEFFLHFANIALTINDNNTIRHRVIKS